MGQHKTAFFKMRQVQWTSENYKQIQKKAQQDIIKHVNSKRNQIEKCALTTNHKKVGQNGHYGTKRKKKKIKTTLVETRKGHQEYATLKQVLR